MSKLYLPIGVYVLKKADAFKIVERDTPIENLKVTIKNGLIDGKYGIANIKVYFFKKFYVK